VPHDVFSGQPDLCSPDEKKHSGGIVPVVVPDVPPTFIHSLLAIMIPIQVSRADGGFVLIAGNGNHPSAADSVAKL
jgi:hypothetical protein